MTSTLDSLGQTTKQTQSNLPASAFFAEESMLSEYAMLIESMLSNQDAESPADIERILGAGPYEELRRSAGRGLMRSVGAFFTSQEMAQVLWKPALDQLNDRSIVVDPACGAGDLLLIPAHHLSSTGNLSDLGRQIRGSDSNAPFVDVARTRLALLANSVDSSGSDWRGDHFPGVVPADFLKDSDSPVSGATHVVLNPPFNPMIADESVSWAKGSINSAALFVSRALASMDDGARLLAILPEVLRTGSRYELWREVVMRNTSPNRIESLGQFDHDTDVHVFILDVTKDAAGIWKSGWTSHRWSDSLGVLGIPTVGSLFEVKVGSLVPHRHDQLGEEVKYLTSRDLADWDTLDSVVGRRRFSGRTDIGPTVVIKRTSRPGDMYRARASVIASDEPVAYENHLIVLKPLDGTLAACQQLLRVLKLSSTTSFLDERMQCRHLTVGSVKEIPWSD